MKGFKFNKKNDLYMWRKGQIEKVYQGDDGAWDEVIIRNNMGENEVWKIEKLRKYGEIVYI